MRAISSRFGHATLLALAVCACSPRPFVVHVGFPDRVDLVRGASVVYAGVRIGEVINVVLSQDDSDRAALVTATLAITDPAVQLRAADRFHVGSLRGVSIIRIEPAREASSPIARGATVAGVSPFVSRVEENMEAAIEEIGALAAEAVAAAMDAIREDGRNEGTNDAVSEDPTPPR